MTHTISHSLQSLREAVPVAVIKSIMCVILLCLCLTTQAWIPLSVSPGNIILGAYGQGYELADTIEVTASGWWMVSTNVNWLRFDTVYANKEMFNQYGDTVTTFSGNGNGRFTVKVFHNAGGPEREGTIRVATEGAIREISIMQDWGAIEMGGVRYGRLNPHIPFDTSVGVIAKSGYRKDNTGPYIGNAGYSGYVIIPSTVVYSNRTYNVEYIHADAFINCGDLTSVKIPNSVTKIDDYAFAGSGITSIDIPTSVTEIGKGTFSGCNGLTDITIPNSVTILGRDLCNGCSNLTSAKLPGSAIHAYEYDFGIDGMKLGGFDGSYSFWYCPLTTLEVGWDTPPNVYQDYAPGMWVDMFSGDLRFYMGGKLIGEATNFNYTNSTLIVPPGTQELYAAAGVWKNFGANITAVALSVNTNSILFGKNKEMSAKINVTSNTSWTVSADVDWLSIGRINGSGNSFFAVTAYRNNTGTERTGVITVSNTFGNVTQSITVTQDAAN